MTKITIIILDFDGVILESVSVKTDAFRTLFSFAPEHVDKIVQFHQQNGGMSRFDKFDYIYRNILRVPLTNQKKQELSDEFSALVFKKIISAPFVTGAYEFIKKFHASIPLYIVSATPEQELRDIVRARNLTPFFRNIYGAPRKKAECISEIFTRSGISASDVIFVGDALNDLAAAQLAGVKFIGRVADSERNIFRNCQGVERVITNLNELSGFLEEVP